MAGADWNDKWAALLQRLAGRSPAGHLSEVLSGCSALAGSPPPEELSGRACSEHNERGALVVPIVGGPDGATGIVCEAARQGSRSQRLVPYYDPRSDLVFTVDQEKQMCVSSEKQSKSTDLDAELQGLVEERAKPYRVAVQSEMDRYVAQRYTVLKAMASAVAVFTFKGKEEDEIELRVVLSSKHSRPRGFWAGNWSSQWRIVLKPEQSDSAMLGGIIEFATHYSEQGNVHFRRKAVKRAKVEGTGKPEKLAANLATAIGAFEDEFHVAVEEECISFGASSLQAVRRVLPMSKEKFDWRQVKLSLARDLKAVSKEDGRGEE